MSGSRVSVGLLIALGGAAALWVFLFRTRAGFAQQVGGLAPAAARYAGFSSRKALWVALLTSGGAAGLAGCAGSGRADRPAHALCAGGLRVCRDHRGLRRPAAPGGHGVFGRADEHVLYRRRTRAVAPGPAQVDHRGVPGPAAVHAAGLRHADCLPAQIHREDRSNGILCLAAGRDAERRHRAGHRRAGPADQRESRHRQPRGRGHDAVRGRRRLCHRGAHRQRLARLCRRHGRRRTCWPACSACW